MNLGTLKTMLIDPDLRLINVLYYLKTHLIGLIPGLFVDYTQILRLYSYQMSFILFYDLLNFKLGNWLYKFEHCDNICVST